MCPLGKEESGGQERGRRGRAKVGGMTGAGVGAGVGKHSEFQVSGLSRREPGSGVQVRVQVQDLNFARTRTCT